MKFKLFEMFATSNEKNKKEWNGIENLTFFQILIGLVPFRGSTLSVKFHRVTEKFR